MRLYPIAVAQVRTATRDFDIEGYRINKGDMLYMANTVSHFQEEYFPNPDTFDIDRHLPPREEYKQPRVFSPFGRGSHTCLGKTLAEIQLVLTVARLFYKLDMSLPYPGYELKTKTAPTPGPAMSFQVKINGTRH
jgi:cytochrome P450